MKNNQIFIKLSLATLLLSGIAVSCKDEFLEQTPLGTFPADDLKTLKGVEGILIGAYATVDGRPGSQTTGTTNWVHGSVASDDANKGTEPNDFSAINDIELYRQLPSNGPVGDKWLGTIDGIGMANQVFIFLEQATGISEADQKRIAGEAHFLRGFFHMEGKKVFGPGFPYIDQTAQTPEQYVAITNTTDIWPQIEADLKFAYDNLPGVMPNPGRVNKYAAGAFLAKAYLFQGKYAEAKVLLDDVITNGTTASGLKYGLHENYGDNFRVGTKNGKESVFSTQSAVNDGANDNTNGNYENTLNYPHGAGDKPGGCCGFFQPSQTLVNSFMTDPTTGLPTMNPYVAGVTSDASVKSDEAFTPYAGTLDPRLDHTVGRRGIPYHDWGLHPGRSWIRQVDNGGPYSPKKNVHSRAEFQGRTAGTGNWGQAVNALNFNLMRFADVLLMAAEVEANLGNLTAATDYVNQIRARAANPKSMIMKADGTPAANYKISVYPAPFADKTTALNAIMEERKLELGMEGHRKFDLVRWGIADVVLNRYVTFERLFLQKFGLAQFQKNQDEYMPIPEGVINTSRDPRTNTANLKQNPGYN